MCVCVWWARTLHPFISLNHSQLHQSLPLTSSHQQRVQLWMIRSVHTHISFYHMTHTKNKRAATIHTYTSTDTHLQALDGARLYVLQLLWCLHCNVWENPPTPFIKLPLSSGHHHEQFPWQHTSKHWWQSKKDPSWGFGHLLSKRNRGRRSLSTVIEVWPELASKLFNLPLEEL